MEEQLISFETAKLAKEKGFGKTLDYIFQYAYKIISLTKYVKVLNSQNNTKDEFISAPKQSEFQKWLREIHNIHLTITSISQESWQCHLTRPGEKIGDNYIEDAYYYEEALEEGLQESLKLITNEK